MVKSFEAYRHNCFKAIRQLLAHKGESIVTLYVLKAKATTTAPELSRIMVDVRHEI